MFEKIEVNGAGRHPIYEQSVQVAHARLEAALAN